MGPVRVLIADDHALFAKTLEALLAGNTELEVVGVAVDGLEAVALCATHVPDVVLMDLDMPHLDGFGATRRIRELGLPSQTIVLTASDDPADSQRAHEAGAIGYLTKDRLTTSLVPAIIAAAGRPATLTRDGGAELAGRARLG
jgi:DNA-binding NarL/FixJ family response regulator